MPKMKSPYDQPYKGYSAEAFKRRMEKQRKQKLNADDSEKDPSRSRLSSTR